MSKLTLSTFITLLKIVSSLIFVIGRGVAKMVDLCDDGKINSSSEFSVTVNNFFDNYVKFLDAFGFVYDFAMRESGKSDKSFFELVTSKVSKENIKNIADIHDLQNAHAGIDFLHSEYYLENVEAKKELV